MSIMYVWCVRVERQRCVFLDFSEALEDWKSHDSAWIYPKFMKVSTYERLKEFDGW